MEVYQIVGTPDQAGWSQIHILPAKADHPQAGEAVLLLAAPVSAQDGASLGREILARFTEKYFLDRRESRLQALQQALTALAQEKPLYAATKDIPLTVVAAVNRPPFQWLGIIGQGEIWLFRDGQLQPLLPSQPDKKVAVVSGQAREDDLLILGSQLFFQVIPQATLAASLKTGDPRRAQEILSPLVYQQAKGQLAAAILRFPKATPEKIPPTTEAAPVAIPPTAPPEAAPTLATTKLKIPSLKLPRFPWSQFHLNVYFPHFRWPFSPDAIKVRSGYPPPHRRLWRGLAVLFLLLLGASLIWGWQRQAQNRRRQLVAQKTAQAAELMNKARAVRQLDTDKSLALAKEGLLAAEAGLKIDPLNPELQKLRQELKKLIALSGGQEITPDLFFDLRVIADDVAAQSWDFDGHYFYILDHSGRLLRLEKDSKNSQILSRDPLLKKFTGVLVSSQQIYGWTQQGIYRLTKGEFQEARPGDINPGDLLAGWGGNIYRVDNQARKIWKYIPRKGKLAKPQPWLKKAVKVNWPATGLAINGSLWLLEKNGQIDRFYAGRQDSFPRQPEAPGARFLTTANNIPSLAFWSQEKKMLIVLSKKGQLISRLPLKVDHLQGLVLTAGGKKVFLLTANKILQVTLSW